MFAQLNLFVSQFEYCRFLRFILIVSACTLPFVFVVYFVAISLFLPHSLIFICLYAFFFLLSLGVSFSFLCYDFSLILFAIIFSRTFLLVFIKKYDGTYGMVSERLLCWERE